MSRTSLALDSAWVDYWGAWNPLVEPLAEPLERSNCHGPRLVLLPDVVHQTIPASGKLEYSFYLVPGSVIWGFWIVPGFAVQFNDVSLQYQFFQGPVKSDFLITQGAQFGRFPSFTLLPTPHPVTGEGLFKLEAWGAPGASFRMVLGVAELTDCPVR